IVPEYSRAQRIKASRVRAVAATAPVVSTWLFWRSTTLQNPLEAVRAPDDAPVRTQHHDVRVVVGRLPDAHLAPASSSFLCHASLGTRISLPNRITGISPRFTAS